MKELSKAEMFEPLEKYTPEKIWDNMMFMGLHDNIFLYKHEMTRCYINIDKDGKYYAYTGNDSNPYIEISFEEAWENLELDD